MPAKFATGSQALATALLMAVALVISGSQVAIVGTEGPQKITGAVMVKERDDDGNVRSVSIWDGTWGVVGVAMKGKGLELLSHVGDVVKATGTIDPAKADDSVSFVIRVKTF